MKPLAMISFATLMFWSVQVASQVTNGYVANWDDGSPMKCAFYFDEEPLLEWNTVDPPPVTVQTANAIVRYWSEQNGFGSNPLVQNYRLILTRPVGHSHRSWVWFLEILTMQPGAAPIGNSAFRPIAITMQGKLVEPECNIPE